MNKYTELFCQQNPKMTFPCGNPNCKKEHTFKSKDVFKGKSFEFQCKFCGSSTKIDTSKFIKDFESQLKKLGIRLK